MLRAFPQMGQRYLPISEREVREVLYGHYRIPYEVTEDAVRIIGVYHTAMDIRRILGGDG